MVKSGNFHHPSLLEPLTKREVDILKLIVAGLPNAEIGLQLSLSEGTVRWNNTRIFSKLGVESRAGAIAKANAERIFQEPIIPIDDQPRANLPAQPTTFIGREHELQTIIKRITAANCRLLTLTGAGGMGKTRLAIQAASQLLSDFPDGVFFVPLAAISQPEQVIATIAQVCQLGALDGGDVRQQLFDFLYQKRSLLVLDNFEHLLDGKFDVCDILEKTLHTRILITAREPLHVSDEWTQTVIGLTYPASSAVQEYEHYDAVQLFRACAERKGISLSLDENLPHIAHICRLTQGMPLAIKLAASWLRTFSCKEISQKLGEDIDLLNDPNYDTAERHQSMRKVFEQSWNLLNEHDQKILWALGIFWGSFTSTALIGVVGATLDDLKRLCDRDFVQQTGRGRYELHPLITQFLHEYLRDSGDLPQVSAAHAAYYADFMRARRQHLMGGQRQLAALDEIQADFENVSAAWTWVIDQQDYDNIEKIWETLLLYISVRGGSHLLNDVRKLPVTAAQPHHMLSYLLCWMDDTTEADVQRALTIAEHYHDLRARAFALDRMGGFFSTRHDYETALELHNESLVFFQQLGEDSHAADVLMNISFVYETSGDTAKAMQAAKESYRIYHNIGDRVGLSNCLHGLAAWSLYQGDYAASEKYLRESHALCQELNIRFLLLITTLFLGHFPLFDGDIEGARRQYHEALHLADDIGGELPKVFACLLGFLANGEGDYLKADSYFNESRGPARPAMFVTLFINWAQSVAKCGIRDYTLAQEYVCAAFQFAHQSNNIALMTMCLPSAALILWHKERKALAVEVMALWFSHPKSLHGWFVKSPLGAHLVEDMKVELGEEAFDETWRRGKSRDLRDTVAALLALFAETPASH